MPAIALTAGLVAACSVALLDDAMFLVVILAATAIALVSHGIGRLLAALPQRRA